MDLKEVLQEVEFRHGHIPNNPSVAIVEILCERITDLEDQIQDLTKIVTQLAITKQNKPWKT